jgi:hypothetical protein
MIWKWPGQLPKDNLMLLVTLKGFWNNKENQLGHQRINTSKKQNGAIL